METRGPLDPEAFATVHPFRRAGQPPEPEEGRFAPGPGELAAAAAPKRFPIQSVDELEIGEGPTCLIEGLLSSTGLGIVFGLPKSGKSFLLADALFHVAMGRRWAGRDVLQGPVVYITSEGVEGFKRRLIAMRRHYGVEGQRVPFLVITVAPDLGHASGDAEALIESIRDYLAPLGGAPIRAVAIDTLARTMKGADENTAKDMSTFVDNCEAIGTALGCIVIGVHHAGKDLTKGSRGSNALDGAVDVMWSVEKGEASSTATIHHMKDSEAGASWQFRLIPHVLREGGATSQNVAAAVVEIVTEPGGSQPAATKRNVRLPDQPKMLLSIIREACAEAGDSVRGDPNVPHDVRSMSRENLKRYLPIKGYWDSDKPDNANRSNFSRDLKTLKVRGFIGLTVQWVWLPKGAL